VESLGISGEYESDSVFWKDPGGRSLWGWEYQNTQSYSASDNEI